MSPQPKMMLNGTDEYAANQKRYDELATRFDSLSEEELEEFGFLKSLVKEVGRRMLGREKKDEGDEGGSSDFDESEHPRDADDGRFVLIKGGSKGGSKTPPEAPPKEDLEGDIKRTKKALEVAKAAKKAAENKAQAVADKDYDAAVKQWEKDKKTHESEAKKAHAAKMKPLKETRNKAWLDLKKAETEYVDDSDYRKKIDKKKRVKGLKTKLERYDKQLKEKPEPFSDPKPEKIDVTPGKKGIKYVPFI